MAENHLIQTIDDRVCRLVISRPGKRNSLTPELLLDLEAALDHLARSDDVRAVIISGAGERAFSAGYDIAAIPADLPPEERKKRLPENFLYRTIRAIRDYPYPVLAMINGHAFGGGCELAASCDIRIAAPEIKMGMPPAKLGWVYSPEGLVRFVQAIGLTATKDMFFSGRPLTGTRAYEIGLVNHLVPKPELEDFSLTLAREIGANAPLSLKGTKRMLTMLAANSALNGDQLTEAQALVDLALDSDDLKEGQAAFLEKRKPVFRGR